MKSFITAIILLTATIFSVVLNAVYVDNATDALLEAVEAMPSLKTLEEHGLKDDGSDNTQNDKTEAAGDGTLTVPPSEEEIRIQGHKAISDFKKLWEKKRHVLELFVAYENISNIQTAIDQLVIFFEGEYYTDYGAQRAVLITAVKRLNEIEDLSFDSIM